MSSIASPYDEFADLAPPANSVAPVDPFAQGQVVPGSGAYDEFADLAPPGLTGSNSPHDEFADLAPHAKIPKGVDGIAQRLAPLIQGSGYSPDYLARIIHFESGGNPAATNKSGATGIIQFMPSTAKGLGTTTDALRNMTFEQQVPYVLRYLQGAKVKPGDPFSNYYQGVLYGTADDRKDNEPLWRAGSKEYEANAANLDPHGTGVITKGMAAAAAYGTGFGVSLAPHNLGVNPDAQPGILQDVSEQVHSQHVVQNLNALTFDPNAFIGSVWALKNSDSPVHDAHRTLLPTRSGDESLVLSSAAQQVGHAMGLPPDQWKTLLDPSSPQFKAAHQFASRGMAPTPDDPSAAYDAQHIGGLQRYILNNNPNIGTSSDAALVGKSFAMASSPSTILAGLAGDERDQSKLPWWESAARTAGDLIGFGMAGKAGSAAGMSAKALAAATAEAAANSGVRGLAGGALKATAENILFQTPGVLASADDYARQHGVSYTEALKTVGGDAAGHLAQILNPGAVFDENLPASERASIGVMQAAILFGAGVKGYGHMLDMASDARVDPRTVDALVQEGRLMARNRAGSMSTPEAPEVGVSQFVSPGVAEGASPVTDYTPQPGEWQLGIRDNFANQPGTLTNEQLQAGAQSDVTNSLNTDLPQPGRVVVQGNELGEGLSDFEIKKAAQQWGKKNLQGNSYPVPAAGYDATVTGSGLKEMTRKGHFYRAQLIVALPDILKNAEFIDSVDPKDDSEPNLVRVDRFKTPVTLDGRDLDLISQVKIYNDGRRIYTWDESNYGKAPVGQNGGGGVSGADPNRPSPGATDSISPQDEPPQGEGGASVPPPRPKPVVSPGGGADLPPTSSVSDSLSPAVEKGIITHEQADSISQLWDARANSWAKENGSTPEEFYRRFGPQVRVDGTGAPAPFQEPTSVHPEPAAAEPVAEKTAVSEKPEATPSPEPSTPATTPATQVGSHPDAPVSQTFHDSLGNPFTEERMNPKDIGVMDGMQFKTRGIVDSKNNVTGAMKDVEKYDQSTGGPLTVWETKDGQRWVMNGHHRRELAIRTNEPDVPVRIFKESDGIGFKGARALGALQNIMDGKGHPIDVATVLRDLGMSVEKLRSIGISTRRGLAKDGLSILKLAPRALKMVEDGQVSAEYAAGVADAGHSERLQVALMHEGIKHKFETRAQGEEAAAIAKEEHLVRLKGTGDPNQGSMFGDDDLEPEDRIYLGEQVKISQEVSRALKRDKTALSLHERLRKVGGTIIDKGAQEEEANLVNEANWSRDPESVRVLEEEAKRYATEPTQANFEAAVSRVKEARLEAAKRFLDAYKPKPEGSSSPADSLHPGGGGEAVRDASPHEEAGRPAEGNAGGSEKAGDVQPGERPEPEVGGGETLYQRGNRNEGPGLPGTEDNELELTPDEIKNGRRPSSGAKQGEFPGLGDEADGQTTLFQKGQKDPFIAIHNTRAKGVLVADRLGGIPSPSIGVTKPELGLRGFGDISLVGDRNLADPKLFGNRLYGSDVYSPRQPRPTHPILRDRAVLVAQEFDQAYRDVGGEWPKGTLLEQFKGKENNREEINNAIATSAYGKLQYLREHGIDPELAGDSIDKHRAIDKLVDEHGGQAAVLDWVEEKTKGIFGQPTMKLGGKTVEYNLENVTRKMASKVRDQEGGLTKSIGSQRARAVTQFSNLEKAREGIGNIVGEGEMEAAKEATSDAFFKVTDDLSGHYKYPNGFSMYDDASQAIGDYLKGKRFTPDAMRSALARRDFEGPISDEAIHAAMDVAKRIDSSPTEYFESKPARSVGLGEFRGAAVPEGTPQNVIDTLNRHGLQVETYTPNDHESRVAAIQRITDAQPDTLFQDAVNADGPVKGAVTFSPDEQPVVHLFTGQSDVSTVLHESAHIFRRTLSEADSAIIDRVLGPIGNVPAEERFARMFERYTRDGRAPTPELASVFDRFKSWLSNIYQKITGSPIAEQVHPEVRDVFDRMLGGGEPAAPADHVVEYVQQRAAQFNPKNRLVVARQLGITPDELDAALRWNERQRPGAGAETTGRGENAEHPAAGGSDREGDGNSHSGWTEDVAGPSSEPGSATGVEPDGTLHRGRRASEAGTRENPAAADDATGQAKGASQAESTEVQDAPGSEPELAGSREEPPQTTGLSNATQEETNPQYGLREAEKGKSRSPEEIQAKGEADLAAKPDPIAHAIEMAHGVAKGDVPFNSDNAGMLLAGDRRIKKAISEVGDLLDRAIASKSEDVGQLQAKYEDLVQKHQQFLDDVQKGKTEWHNTGQALQAGATIDEGDFSDALTRKTREKGAPLSKAERTQLKEAVDEVKRLRAEVARLEAPSSEAEAQKALGREARRTNRAASKDQVKVERTAILGDLKKELSKAGSTLNAGAPSNTPEIMRLLGKLAVNVIHDGALTLADIVDRVNLHLKGEGLPEQSDRTIHDALSGYYDHDEAPKTPTDAAARVRELKQTARLMSQLNDAMAGKGIKGKSAPITSDTVAGMRKSLDEILKMQGLRKASAGDPAARLTKAISEALDTLENGKSAASPKTPDTPEVAALREQLANLRKQIDDKWGGKPPKAEAVRLREIQDRIAKAEAQLKGKYRDIKAKGPVDTEAIEAAKGKLDDFRAQIRVEDQISELERQLREKDFPEPKSKREKVESEELTAKRQQLKDAEWKVRREIAAGKMTPTAEAVKQGYRALLVSSLGIPAKVFRGFAYSKVADSLGALPASAWDHIISAATGQHATDVHIQTVMDALGDAKSRQSVERLWKILKGDAPPAEGMAGATRNLHQIHTNSPAYDKVVNTVFNSHSAMYTPLLDYGYAKSIREQARLMARNSGGKLVAEKLIADPTPEMMQRARSEAAEGIFMNQNVLGKYLGDRKDMRTTPLGTAADFGATMLAPVPTVASNVAGRILEHSPLGFAKAIYESGSAIKKAKAGQMDASFASQREASKSFGRATVGLGGLYAGYALYKAGLLSSLYDQSTNGKTKDRPARTQQEGGYGNFRLPVVGNVSADDSPIGYTMALGALWAEEEQKAKGKDPAAQESFWAHFHNLHDIAQDWTGPVVEGAKEIMKMKQEPQTEIPKFGQRQLLSLLPPAPVASLAKTLDYGHDRQADTLVQKVEARIPFLRNTLPPAKPQQP